MFFNNSNTHMPSTTTIVSTAASVAATIMIMRSIVHDLLPYEARGYMVRKLKNLISRLSNELTIVIEEYEDGLNQNKLFKAAKLYLEPVIPPNVKRIKVNLPNREKRVSVSVETNEQIFDVFNGVHFKWKFASKQVPTEVLHSPDHFNFNSKVKSDVKFFELCFHRKHKDMVLATYIPHVLQKAKEISKQKKTLKLFTLGYPKGGFRDVWQPVNLDHPATFNTLAMNSDVKNMIMEDLERFVKRKEFYRRVGKAWKRGYLLFGPPGTGKSSLIAAMANYLKFDVYDLELTNLRGNTELRHLLIATENRSILVVEDIDCSIELQDRLAGVVNPVNPNWCRPVYDPGPRVTLSGFLNFIDGLWSSCGDERIIVFTTNRKDRLDAALLRPGRMDVHIHMSYCTPCGFKMLARNYLGITEHPLFTEIEELIEKTKVTPADVGERLMRNEVPDTALRGLIEFLEIKEREKNEGEAKEAEEKAAEAESMEKLKEKTTEK